MAAELKVGFTGTRKGMTGSQYMSVKRLLHDLQPTDAYHGGCTGADTDFHILSLACGIAPEIFPSNIPSTYGFWKGAKAIHSPNKPLVRNRIIVHMSDVLIATPKGSREELRSGTWATIRYMRRRGKLIYIVFPDGVVRIEE